MKRFLILAAIVLIVALVSAPAFAATSYVVESRTDGWNSGGFTQNGMAVSGLKCLATNGTPTGACKSLLGSYYQTAGSAIWADYSYTPAAGLGGYYNVSAAWGTSTNGWVYVNYTVNGTITTTWNQNQNVTFLGVGGGGKVNIWNRLATGVLLTAGTPSTVHSAITNFTAPGGGSGILRLLAAAALWEVATPAAVTNVYPANAATNVPVTGGGNSLVWTPGANNATFDVLMDTNTTPTTVVATGLTTPTWDTDALPLVSGTHYYWRIRSNNADATPVLGPIGNFTATSTLAYVISGQAVTRSETPAPNTHTISTVGGTVTGQAWWIPGTAAITYTEIPTAAPHYYFMGWTSDVAGTTLTTNPGQTSPTTTVLPTVDPTTFYAQFALDITAPTGSISINGGATYAADKWAVLTLAATDTQSGMATMSFSNDNSIWSDPVAYATSAAWVLNDSPLVEVKTVYVKFTDVATNVSTTYSDTIEIPNGTQLLLDNQDGQAGFGVLSINGVPQTAPRSLPSNTIWLSGTSMTLTAAANPGYTFWKWTNESNQTLGTLYNTTLTFSMPSDTKYVYANYAATTALLTATQCPTGGTALITDPTPEEATKNLAPAVQSSVTASAATNYKFTKWTVSTCGGANAPDTTWSSATDNPYTFSMPPNAYTLVANFEYLPLLTTTANANGSVSGDGTDVGGTHYDAGSSRTVSATADAGYFLYSWSTAVGGTPVVHLTTSSTDTSYTFNMPVANYTLFANFRQTPLLTVGGNPSAGGTASIDTASPTLDSRYVYGSSVTVSTTVNTPTYRLFGWSTDLAGLHMVHFSTGPADLSYTFNMPSGNYTLYAQYGSPDLIWQDSFEGGTPPAGWTLTGTPPVVVANQNNFGTHALKINGWFDKAVFTLPQPTASAGKAGFRFWMEDSGQDIAKGFFAEVRNPGAGTSMVLGLGVSNSLGSAISNYEYRSLASVSQGTPWAYSALPTTSRTAGWHRCDISYDGTLGANATVVYYIDGVVVKTVTDIPANAFGQVWVGQGGSSGVLTPWYFDDFAVFTSPAVLATSAINSGTGSGTVTGTLNGLLIKGSAGGLYYPGENVVLTATAVLGSQFLEWRDENGTPILEGGNPAPNPYAFTMTINKTANAVFQHNDAYKLLTLVGVPAGGGTIGGAGYYLNGTSVTPTASAAAGMSFINWTSDLAGQNAVTLPSVLNADTTLYAQFKFRAFTEGFETRNDGDIDMQGMANHSANGNGAGNPWFGAKATGDCLVTADLRANTGIIQHSGGKAVFSTWAGMNAESAINLAYRFNNGNAFAGDVYMDWWFFSRAVNAAYEDSFRDFAGLTKYTTNPALGTPGYDYGFGGVDYPSTANLRAYLTQFLAIGGADIQTAGFDVTKYQIRCIGSPRAYDAGWINTTVDRTVGWHHAKIVLGPAKGGGTNDAMFYIDGTLVATEDTGTTGGVNSMSVYIKDQSAGGGVAQAGAIDDIQFGKAGTESIDKWMVIGHYDNATQATRMTTDYFAAGPGGGTEATMAAKTGATYNTKSWAVYKSGSVAGSYTGGGIVDFNRFYNPLSEVTTTTNGASYLFTYINNSGPAITDAYMTCGSDDGIKVFLNGTAIYTNDVYRGLTADQDSAPLFTIPSGVSRLLVKITQGTSFYQSQVRITRADGSPLTNGTNTVTYELSDATVPTGTVSINGGAASTTNTAVSLTLSATDDLSGIAKIELSNNSDMSGATVVDVNLLTSPYTQAWVLADGTRPLTATVYARFTDRAGNVSAIVNDTITLATAGAPPAPTHDAYHPVKISDLWPLAGGIEYGLHAPNGKVVTAIFSDGFAIEETDRSAGIMVKTTGGVYFTTAGKTAIAVGDVVDIYGVLSVVAGESRTFNADYVLETGPGTVIKPLAVTQKYIVGKGPNANTPGLPTGKGIYSAGLFVRLAGNVLSPGTGFFFLDDKTYASGIGIKVFYGGTIPTSGNKIVTGVVGMVGNNPVIYATNVQ